LAVRDVATKTSSDTFHQGKQCTC